MASPSMRWQPSSAQWCRRAAPPGTPGRAPPWTRMCCAGRLGDTGLLDNAVDADASHTLGVGPVVRASGGGKRVSLDLDRLRRQRPWGRRIHHRAVGDRVFAARAGAVDRGGDAVYQTSLMRTDCAECLELALLGLSDHRLGVGEDFAVSDWYVRCLTLTGPPAPLDPLEASPEVAAGWLSGAVA